MRFKKWPRHAFHDTSRKRQALRRKQRQERDALPLLADQIAEAQPDEDRVMRERAEAWADQERAGRRTRAAKWREARRRIAMLPEGERKALRRVWNCAPYPADPSYLLGVIDSHARGRIDVDTPPFPLCATDPAGARITNLFARPGLFVTILAAREIAADPGAHSMPKRHAAYHHLQAAADRNKDRERAREDRLLASMLFLHLEDQEDPHA